MHAHKLIVMAALLAIVLATQVGVRAESTAEEEAWARAMTPGEPHAGLADQAGEWRYVVTMWHEPGGEATTLEGVATKRMTMGGRFLEEELWGEFQGRPFRGFGITGYDNVTREYVAIWLDNAGTGIHYYTGREDADGAHTYTTTLHDPATGRAMRNRSVGRVIDRDHHTFESYMPGPDGNEYLHMRVEYTRVGP